MNVNERLRPPGDHLLIALKILPGVREFYTHVHATAPAKDNSYAPPRPRLCVQDILILLSRQANPDAPCVLVSVTEACVYHAATTDFASSTWQR